MATHAEFAKVLDDAAESILSQSETVWQKAYHVPGDSRSYTSKQEAITEAKRLIRDKLIEEMEHNLIAYLQDCYDEDVAEEKKKADLEKRIAEARKIVEAADRGFGIVNDKEYPLSEIAQSTYLNKNVQSEIKKARELIAFTPE